MCQDVGSREKAHILQGSATGNKIATEKWKLEEENLANFAFPLPKYDFSLLWITRYSLIWVKVIRYVLLAVSISLRHVEIHISRSILMILKLQ